MMHLHTFYFLHGESQYDFIFTSNISGKIPFTSEVFFKAFFILKCKVVVYSKHCYKEEIFKKKTPYFYFIHELHTSKKICYNTKLKYFPSTTNHEVSFLDWFILEDKAQNGPSNDVIILQPRYRNTAKGGSRFRSLIDCCQV